MTTTRETRPNEAGFILATVLVFLVVLSLTAFLAAKLTRSDIQVMNNLQNEKEALTIAEAGVTEALYRLSVASPTCVTLSGVNGAGADACASAKFDASLQPVPAPTPAGGLPTNSYHWSLVRTDAGSTAEIYLGTTAPTTSTNDSVVPSLQPASLRQPYSNTASGSAENLKISWDVCTVANIALGCSAAGAIRTYTKPVAPGETAQPRQVVKIVSTGQSGTARRTVTAWAADISREDNTGIVLTGSGCGDGLNMGNGGADLNVTGTIAVNSGFDTSVTPPVPCSLAVQGSNNTTITATAINVVGQAESGANSPTYSVAPNDNAGSVADPYASKKPPCPTYPGGTCAATLETGYSSYNNPVAAQNHSSNSALPTSCTGTVGLPVGCVVSGGSSGSPVQLQPGVYYGGLVVTGYANFAPGVYIMAGNDGSAHGGTPSVSFDMSTGQTSTTGTGLMIYTTNVPGCAVATCGYGATSLKGGNTSTGLHASTNTSDPYFGILFWQDRNNTLAVSLQNGNSSEINFGGSVYAPNAALAVTASTNWTVAGLLVGKSLTMGGGATLSVAPTQDVSEAGLIYRTIAWQDF
jgi:Tfp pilus assembly protein PilX